MIRFAKLRKEYDTLVAVHDLDVEIPEGEVCGLIGPNGAGKTTTLRMACGLQAPTDGKVFVNGVDVHSEPERAQTFIGYLADFFSVYEDLKVWEYLDYFANAYKMRASEIPGRIDEVIAQAGLEMKRDAFIKGLSRGMKQRLGIARAVIHRPKVLLLDEPASGLDPQARLDLRNVLLALRDAGATIVISSHILTELEGCCTSILLMEKGRLVRSGRIDEILAAANTARVVRLRWVQGAGADVEASLKLQKNVADVVVRGSEGSFKFSGSEDDLAYVLAALLAAGVRVTAFGEVKQTVEDLYVKLSHNEAM